MVNVRGVIMSERSLGQPLAILRKIAISALIAMVFLFGRAQAVPVTEYASSVLGFSSQYSSGSWSAAQALGAPNTTGYGDITTAWAPSFANGTFEFISVGFATPIYSDGVTIRETDGNGFIYKVDVIDTANISHTVWAGTDPGLPGSPVNFLVSFSLTSYLVKGVTVYTDTNHDRSAWEEIDSIELRGDTNPPQSVPETASSGLLLTSAFGLLGVERLTRKKRISRNG
jgi:hypothetical protein